MKVGTGAQREGSPLGVQIGPPVQQVGKLSMWTQIQ